VIKQSAQVGWLAGGNYFVCDAGYLDVSPLGQCSARPTVTFLL